MALATVAQQHSATNPTHARSPRWRTWEEAMAALAPRNAREVLLEQRLLHLLEERGTFADLASSQLNARSATKRKSKARA